MCVCHHVGADMTPTRRCRNRGACWTTPTRRVLLLMFTLGCHHGGVGVGLYCHVCVGVGACHHVSVCVGVCLHRDVPLGVSSWKRVCRRVSSCMRRFGGIIM